MSLGGESIAIDETLVGREVKDAWSRVSWLLNNSLELRFLCAQRRWIITTNLGSRRYTPYFYPTESQV